MNKKLLINILIIGILFLIGCQTPYQKLKGEDVFKEEQVPEQKELCKEPYIEYRAGECCLDQNNNEICDKDETQVEEPVEKHKGFSKTFYESIPKDKLSRLELADLTFTAKCDEINQMGLLDIFVSGSSVFSGTPPCEINPPIEVHIPIRLLSQNNEIIFKSEEGEYDIVDLKLSLTYAEEGRGPDIFITSTGFDPSELSVVEGKTLIIKSAEGRHKLSISGTTTPIIEEGATYDYRFDTIGTIMLFDIFTKKSAYVTVRSR